MLNSSTKPTERLQALENNIMEKLFDEKISRQVLNTKHTNTMHDKTNNSDITLINRTIDKMENTKDASVFDIPKEEIIEKYYETTAKSELKDEIKNMNLHDKEVAIMINQDDLLTEFYHDWLDSDVPLGESMQDTIQESVASITRYYGKQNNFRIQGR